MKNIFKHVSGWGKALALAVVMLAFGGSAYAWTIGAGDVYFDNTVTKWSQVFIRFGTTSWCTVYKMSKVSDNDNIYYFNFQADATGIDAIQFASIGGYDVTSGCNNDCGIYNGNIISDGQKTDYVKTDITGANRCIVATGNTGYCAVSGPQPMPNSVSYGTTTLGGKPVTNSGTVGYFTPSQSVTFAGSTTLSGYSAFPAGVGDYVHATFRYYISGSTYSNISCAGSNTSTKSFSTSVTLPSAPGKYTMSTYYRCGGQNSSTVTSYYHIVGLTGKALDFGAMTAGDQKSLSETLSNVWGGDDVNTVSAVISDEGASIFSFSESESVLSKNIDIANKAGAADIYFTAPAGEGTYTATLTLTLTYDTNKTLTKTYTLKGVTKSADPTVMLGAEPVYLDGPKATLSGYLKYYACSDHVTEAGIVWGTNATPTKDNSTKIVCSTGKSLKTGATWSGTTSTNFSPRQTYYYRAYVYNSASTIYTYSKEVGTFKYDYSCVYPIVGDTVYVTVDASLAAEDDCALKFKTLDNALSAIYTNFCTGTEKQLTTNVVIQVVPAPNKGRYSGTNEVNGINNYNLTAASKVLIIRSANNSLPVIEKLRVINSKNVILDNIRLYAAGQDNSALTISDGITDFYNRTVFILKANILVKNCYIESQGFAGIQVWAYQGITFENNDFIITLPDGPEGKGNQNTNLWGSSIKILQCSEFKFLRNNFRGSHATSLWIQGLDKGLFMNNVFWNNNDSYYADYKDNVCFVRLVTQFPEAGHAEHSTNTNQNLGFYYNTFYLAKNSNEVGRKVDFFRLGSSFDGKLSANLQNNIASTIRFQYNNCYSYDEVVSGSNRTGGNKWCLTASEGDWCASINHNNFWSWIDNIGTATESVFNIPTTCTAPNKNYFVNVYEQVCKATNDPSDLVVKGGDMNFGKHIDSDISQLGAEEIYNDRLYASNGADAIRKVNGKWTLGAYQQTDGNDFAPVKVLIWTGAADSDWDNRANWITPKADGTGYKKLTCVENIDMDVQVIIPAPDNTEYADFIPEGGVPRYPAFPDKFSGTRTDKSNETVNAGHGIGKPTKFASSIELEYGAAIKNIEALKDDDARRYAEANTSFTAGRSEWILVGTVVKPFTDGSKSSVRLVQSGDYFIADHLPHVYMHEAELKGESADWQRAFADLDVSVPYDRVFAIKIPNEYGPKKTTAKMYYTLRDKSKINDGVVPKTFNFNGWFLNDEVIPEYKIDGNKIMSNTYPATLSVEAAQGVNHGSFKVYDYNEQSFENGVEYIKPQNGFIFVPNKGQNDGWFRITPEMLTNEGTKYKSATASNPTLKLRASNPAGTDGSSSVLIIYDELKSDEYEQGPDLINTTIAGMPTKPEVYAMMFGKELDKATVPSLEQAIPLGLKLERAMTVEFTIPTMEGIEKAILEDREANKSYDLLKGEKGSIALAAGTYAGRFFLNLGAEEDVPTEDDPVVDESSSISIFAQEDGTVVISAPLSENLKSAEITDLSGATKRIELKDAHYNIIKLNGAKGAYVVKALGEAQSKVAKVIVK